MAAIQVTIKDADMNNIAVDVHMMPNLPESQLLYTNAQLIAIDVLAYIKKIADEINNKAHRDTLREAIRLD